MEERYITAVDLGTSKILLTVAKTGSDGIRLIYGRETPSQGIRYSRVTNPMQAAEAIKNAVSLAEEELGIKCDKVVVGYPRYEVVQKDDCRTAPRNEKDCVTADDIRNLRDMEMDAYAQNPDYTEDEELLDAVAQSYNCGNEEILIPEKDVIGMTTKELEGNFRLFIGKSKYVSDMDIAFQKAGDISVMRRYFTPIATAKAVLYDAEMENGVALVEFGAGITSVSIFLKGVIRHYAAIPFGGRAVTMDIKTITGIPEPLAENIKKAYGACMPDRLYNFGDKTLMIETDKELASTQLSVQYLSEIITARETEIINAVLYGIQESKFADMIRGVVLTGGGAEMTNISALFKELSGYEVRLGYPRSGILAGGNDLGPGGAAAMGMIMAAVEDGYVSWRPAEVSGEGEPIGGIEVEGGTVEETKPEEPRTKEPETEEGRTEEKPPVPEAPQKVPRVEKKKKKGGFWNKFSEDMGNLFENVMEDETV